MILSVRFIILTTEDSVYSTMTGNYTTASSFRWTIQPPVAFAGHYVCNHSVSCMLGIIHWPSVSLADHNTTVRSSRWTPYNRWYLYATAGSLAPPNAGTDKWYVFDARIYLHDYCLGNRNTLGIFIKPYTTLEHQSAQCSADQLAIRNNIQVCHYFLKWG
jgi:hypothetical protein